MYQVGKCEHDDDCYFDMIGPFPSLDDAYFYIDTLQGDGFDYFVVEI